MSKPMMPKVTSSEVATLFAYDPATGVVTRKVARGGQQVGAVAGCRRPDGYLTVMVNKQPVLLHRLVWALVTGEWPARVIDHDNGHRADNRWTNLRDTSQTGNMLNQHKARISAIGLAGVDPLPNGRYRARLFVRRRIRHLGVFDSAQDAHNVYMAAKLSAQEAEV